jgi:hypothetical protein
MRAHADKPAGRPAGRSPIPQAPESSRSFRADMAIFLDQAGQGRHAVDIKRDNRGPTTIFPERSFGPSLSRVR